MPETTLNDLSSNARDLTVTSLEWSEKYWDAEKALLCFNHRRRTSNAEQSIPIVRNSIWYALGLLIRNEGVDTDHACQTIHAVLDNQFDEPGTPYHGTFYRWVGEPHPPKDAVMWKDYDPNWRQFIGLGLAIILDEYQDRLPEELIARMDSAIQKAVVGEPEGRCPPSYTNIALMKAGLMVYAGNRYGNAEWIQKGEAFGQAIYELFKMNNAFDEYNSPTYYGVNFYALGFWRKYVPSQVLQEMGAVMEAELWQDTAQYYHANMKNIAGPYTRSYGMDMTHYSALIGMYIWLAVGRSIAPFPELDSTDVNAEFCYGPAFGILDAVVPEDALSHFQAFAGERQVERTISTNPKRTATAWLGKTRLLGAESVNIEGDATEIFTKLSDQYHPVTAHWQTPSGEIGWMRLRHMGPVDARAEKDQMTIVGTRVDKLEAKHEDAHRCYTFQFSAPGIDPQKFKPDLWTLPGLTVHISASIETATVTQTETLTEIRYTMPPSENAVRFELKMT